VGAGVVVEVEPVTMVDGFGTLGAAMQYEYPFARSISVLYPTHCCQGRSNVQRIRREYLTSPKVGAIRADGGVESVELSDGEVCVVEGVFAGHGLVDVLVCGAVFRCAILPRAVSLQSCTIL
jgi:hypothetical protein